MRAVFAAGGNGVKRTLRRRGADLRSEHTYINSKDARAFFEGLLSGFAYDIANKCYDIADSKYKQIFSDLGILLMQLGKSYQFGIKEREAGSIMVLKFPKNVPHLLIMDGYENVAPEILYDIGDGEFNASGILVRS